MRMPDGLQLTLRLYQGGEKCFGPGIAVLLRNVAEQGSLRSAAQQMGMAYSKAWRIVKEMEAALDTPLLTSTTGGVHGGGARITPEAERMLLLYQAVNGAASAAAKKALEEFSENPGG